MSISVVNIILGVVITLSAIRAAMKGSVYWFVACYALLGVQIVLVGLWFAHHHSIARVQFVVKARPMESVPVAHRF